MSSVGCDATAICDRQSVLSITPDFSPSTIRASLTVFSILLTLNVWLSVTVYVILAGERYVVAILNALVGFKGVALLAVILVGGTGCIGAYLMSPVCRLYATVNMPASPAAAAVVSAAVSTGGAAVAPSRAVSAAATPAANVPVKPVTEKRPE